MYRQPHSRIVAVSVAVIALSPLLPSALAVERFICTSENNADNPCFDYCITADDTILAGGIAFADCNEASGFLGTYAHGQLFSSAAAEAVQGVSFYVQRDRKITVRAVIIKTGGVVRQGAGSFGGTYKVWSLDGKRHTREVDAWFDVVRAMAIAKDMAFAIAGVVAPEAEAALAALGLVDTVIDGFLTFLGNAQAEELIVKETFFVEEGWHSFTVGVRSQASGALCDIWDGCTSWSYADSIVSATVKEITVWGAGELEPPTVEGPTMGCPWQEYTFTANYDECSADLENPATGYGDVVSYKFHWGNGTESAWTQCNSCGVPVQQTHRYGSTDEYVISVDVRNCEDGTTSSTSTTHNFSVQDWPPSGKPIVLVESEGCCSGGVAEMHVSWRPVADATTYLLHRFDHPQDFVIYEGSDTSYVDLAGCSIKSPQPVRYWVEAKNHCGGTDSRTDSAPYTSGYYRAPPPFSPRNSDATEGYCDVKLTWDPMVNTVSSSGQVSIPVNRATEYQIWRHTQNDPEGAELIGRTNCTSCATFHDNPPQADTSYFYWIESINECGSQQFALGAADIGSRISDAHVAPAGVSATDGDGCNEVTIGWTSDSSMNYRVFREYLDEQGVAQQVEVCPSSRPCRDAEAAPGVAYDYVVEACNSNCSSAVSCPTGRDTGFIAEPNPPPPANVSASQGTVCGGIEVSWDPIPLESGTTEYRVARDDDPCCVWTGQAHGFVDTEIDVQDELSHAYHVLAWNCGSPDDSETTTVTGWVAPGSNPPPPTGVSASDDESCEWVRVAWDPVNHASRYTVQRQRGIDIVDFENIPETYFLDKTAAPGDIYIYKVKARTSCADSAWSSSDNGNARDDELAVPTNPVVDGTERCDHLRITWDEVAYAERYEVFRSQTNFPGVFPNAVVDVPYYDDYAPFCGIDYNYWVRAQDRCYTSDFSDKASGRMDTDNDCDRICDLVDNCDQYNPFQGDCDGDGTGDACEPEYADQDCNGNGVCNSPGDCDDDGIADSCEPAWDQQDCDGDGFCNGSDGDNDCGVDWIPDICEVDCAANGVPDDCELDCNGNGVPDDCDINCDDPNCAPCFAADPIFGSIEACRGIYGGRYTDDADEEIGNILLSLDETGFVSVVLFPPPGESEPPLLFICLARASGDFDECYPVGPTPPEATFTGSINVENCTTSGGYSGNDRSGSWTADRNHCAPDTDGNGIIDTCECDFTPPAPSSYVTPQGNRYLSIDLANLNNLSTELAIRVRFLDLAGFQIPIPDYLWVGAPYEAREEDTSDPGKTFTAAPLTCQPEYHDWSGVDVLHIYGAEIVPGGTYVVQLVSNWCAIELEQNYSEPLQLATGKFGDVVELFSAEGNPVQPDFTDIMAMVQKFMALGSECVGGSNEGESCSDDADCSGGSCDATAPTKAMCQLQPNCVFPNRQIDFNDISADVEAFAGNAYADVGEDERGPCVCPPAVTCRATSCSTNSGCDDAGDGLCVDGYCTDKCGRYSP